MTTMTAAQQAAEARLLEATQQGILAFRQKVAANHAATPDHPPIGWTIPPYESREFWQAVAVGWISEEQAREIEQRRHERRERATAALGKIGAFPNRWSRPEPQKSRQYVNHMATTAARDQRLTPQAKALLQIIRARCGHSLTTETTKGTLGAILGRHVRSIQRYIQELVTFGYITARPRMNKIGAHTGLILHLCEKVLPFWKDFNGLAAWLNERENAPQKRQLLDFIGETLLSPINDPKRKSNILSAASHTFSPRWTRQEAITALDEAWLEPDLT